MRLKEILCRLFGWWFCGKKKSSSLRLYGYTRAFKDSDTGQYPTDLVIIDKTSGALVSTVGPTGVQQITAAATDPTTQRVYASHGGGANAVTALSGCLLEGNMQDGTVSTVGCDPIYGGNDAMPGLAIDSSGNIYGMLLADNVGGNLLLVSVDKVSGNLTVIGESSGFNSGNAIEFGPNDVLYFQSHWIEGPGFSTVNLTTGALTPIGNSFTGFPDTGYNYTVVSDMAFNPENGVMYASISGNCGQSCKLRPALATVNLETGEFTYVGDLPDNNGQGGTTNSITFAP